MSYKFGTEKSFTEVPQYIKKCDDDDGSVDLMNYATYMQWYYAMSGNLSSQCFLKLLFITLKRSNDEH